MKNIFKKNQIIITALAIMIAVAGYLNFTKDKADDSNQIQTSEISGDDLAASEEENNLYADISDENAGVGDSIIVSDTQDLTVEEDADAASEDSSTETASDETAKDTEQASAEDNKSTETAKADDSKKTDAAADDSEANSPGEAILASTTLDSSYFSTAKLTREQMRAKNKETLMDVLADVNVSDEQKQDALDSIIEMTATAEKENAAEILLEAKGFEGTVVSMVDGKVDVVVNCETITDEQVAQIEDIVTRKTGVEVKDIVITSVIIEE